MQFRLWRLITAALQPPYSPHYGRSPIPPMTYDRQLVCFLDNNFERMPSATLRHYHTERLI